jgi:hypothetical protein
MAVLRIFGLVLAWLFTPTNLLATATTTAVAYSWGYVDGYHTSSKTVPSRIADGVKRGLVRITANKKLAEDFNLDEGKKAADAVKPPPPVTAGPRGRDALLSLCHSDPTCRRDGS